MKEVHLICNAHLDTIWQWTEDEGTFAALSTFRSAVDLAGEFDYIFCHNEVTVYRYVERYDPPLFEKIKALIREGKWHVMGGWFLQPDCNMPSGESIVRQILVGRRYFAEHFGVCPSTAINFDSFGHSRGLVQVLSKCGQDSYLITRPYRSQFPTESDQFWWEGFDGSRIKVNRVESYNTPLGQAAFHIDRKAKDQPEDIVCVLWGVGNHGGGPSRKDLADIEALMAKGDMHLIHSTPEQFFARIDPQCVVRESLRTSMPGCYTTMSRVKRKHVELENMLWFTEKICALAELQGEMAYPQKQLDEAVDDLLSCEFHDVLPGTTIKSGEDNALYWIDHAMRILSDLRAQALFALTRGQKPAEPGEYPVIVFNPHPYTVHAPVACEFTLADQNWSETEVTAMQVFDEKGDPVLSQSVHEESNLTLDWRKKVIFEAELAPMAITRYSVRTAMAPVSPIKSERSTQLLQPDRCAEVRRESGLLERISVNGREYLRGPIVPMLFEDNADPWGMGDFQQQGMGRNGKPFTLMEKPDGVFAGMQPVQVIEDGDVYLGIESFLSTESTRIRMEYRLYKNSPAVDIHMDVFWGDADRMLKLKIPMAMTGRYIGQTVYGTEELFMDGRECVAQRFVAMQDGEDCFAVLNNCQYGSSCQDGDVYLSLVRGATYCAHPISDRPLLPKGRFTKKIDQGWQSFDFRLIPAKTDELQRLAAEFNQTPYALNVFPDADAAMPRAFSVTVSDPCITLEAFKKAETGEGYILRLFHNAEGTRSTQLHCGGAAAELMFGPYEVKTLRLCRGALSEEHELCI